jgi:hypothetical protein
MRFLRSLRDSQTPAGQRLQAVRAIEAYRDLVLQTTVPSLQEIRQKLGRLADQEKAPHRDQAVGIAHIVRQSVLPQHAVPRREARVRERGSG